MCARTHACTLTRMPVSVFVRTRNRTATPQYGTAALRRPGIGVALLAAALLVAGCGGKTDEASSIVRTTTNIAGAQVVGLERDTAHACALPTAADPAGGSTRSITHLAGVSEVPADPQRIVVLTTAALDATCAVGLWERVVGAVTLDGPRAQPAYLGYGVLKIPAVGSAGQPDLAKIAELHPDLIIGGIPTQAAGFDALKAIAPTVLVGGGSGWQDEFGTIAEGLGRGKAAEAALDAYRTEATETGKSISANQSQASIVRFTADGTQVQGNNSFAGQILTDVGVQRPTAQRGPSFDVRTEDFDTKVEGDIIYAMFADESGQDHGKSIMRSDTWKDLGAPTDNRTYVVEDTVWHGNGLTAARALVTDLRDTLNGYVTS